MSTIKSTQKNHLQLLRVLHLALFMGQLIFAGLVGYLVYAGFAGTDHSLNFGIAMAVAGFLTAGCILSSQRIFLAKLQLITNLPDLEKKLSAHRQAYIIRFAILEAATMVSIVLLYLTGYKFLLIITGINIVYFIAIRPTKQNTLQALNLSFEELKLFDPVL